MLRPRSRKVLSDIWGNKGRTLLVVLSIAVGVFAIGLVATAQGLLSRNMDESYASVNPADITYLAPAITQDTVDAVKGQGEVDEASGRRYFQARMKVNDGPWKNGTFYALPDYENIPIKKITPVEGDYPPAEGEVLLEKSTLKIIDVGVGDMLSVQAPNGQEYQLRVGGTVQDMNVFPSNFSGSANAYVNFDTLAMLGEPPVFNQLDVTIAGADLSEDDVRQAAIRLRDGVLQEEGVGILAMIVYPPGKHPLTDLINTLSVFLGAIGLLALLLGVFLVINTVNAIVSSQIRQIGVMKALGARTSQISRMYLAMVLVFGLLAFVVAAPLAGFGGRALIIFIANLINFNISSFQVPMYVYGLEIGVGLLVPLLAAAYPIHQGTKITVREAISSYGIEEAGKTGGLLDKILLHFRKLSRPLMLSLRNTFRRKGRLALTLITLTLAGAIFVSIFSVRSSLLRTLDENLAFWNFQVQMSFQQDQPSDRLIAEAKQVEDVEIAESWSGALAFLERPDGTENEGMVIYGIPADSELIRPDTKEGRWLQQGDQNVVVANSDFMKGEPGLKLGDSIHLNILGKEQDWQIVGVIGSRLSGPALYSDFSYFNSYKGKEGLANYLFVKTSDSSIAAQDRAASDLEEHFRAAGIPPSSVDTVSEIRSGAENQFNILIIFMLVMAILLAAVGGLGLAGTMSLNVMERTREIGVMRSIGASNRAVLTIFVSEGMIIGAISWILAALLAIPLSALLSYIVGAAFLKSSLSFAYSFSGVLIWLVAALLLSAMASLFPARRAEKLSVREVLAYE
jgi:putative ABC transport system permease protein